MAQVTVSMIVSNVPWSEAMPMTTKTALAELKKAGSPGTKKIYLRHGACEPLFGVKFGDLGKLKKRIGVNHELAKQLWDTGNSDAQTLALMVVDPTAIKSAELDAWMRPLKYDLLLGMIGELAAKSSFAQAKWKKWSKSKSEPSLVAAYNLLSHWLKTSADEVPIDVVEDALAKIESGIHDAPNRARHAMNNALIAVGVFREDFRDQAFQVAKAIGKVEVDHGETGCKTADATAYIKKSIAHQRKRLRC
jgi:3-methyladenine DNA glycosylase AlkD